MKNRNKTITSLILIFTLVVSIHSYAGQLDNVAVSGNDATTNGASAPYSEFTIISGGTTIAPTVIPLAPSSQLSSPSVSGNNSTSEFTIISGGTTIAPTVIPLAPSTQLSTPAVSGNNAVTTPTIITYAGGAGGSYTSVSTMLSGGSSSSTAGINTSCPTLFKTYMQYGKINNKKEVARLQVFLNKHLGTNLASTGYFNTATLNAVKRFQLKYVSSVLQPWIDAGISKESFKVTPTGYVYKTTLRQINLLECPTAKIPMPILR